MQRIKILDSCRGLAALIVVFHHVYTRFLNLFTNTFPGWFQNIFQFISDMNVQAVLFFFFLSGFSICLSVRNGLPVSKPTFNDYTYRRLKRILPPYYFAVAFTFFCGLIINVITVNDDFNLKTLLGNIFFLQSSKSYKGNWFAPYGDNGPLWSLSFEMCYYFLLPVFLSLIFKYCKTNKLTPPINRIALIAAFTISVICVLINKFFFFPYIAFAALFFVWYAGYFVATLYLQKHIALDHNFFLVLLITIVLFVMNCVIPSATLNKLLFGGAIANVFIILWLLRKKIPHQVTVSIDKGFNFLFYAAGTGSYVLYLLHYPLLMVLRKQKNLALWQLVGAVILFTIFCIWLERSFVRKKWLFLKMQYIK
jgi:peptidoglycan/LPS O-acetylase OafA/YrhL